LEIIVKNVRFITTIMLGVNANFATHMSAITWRLAKQPRSATTHLPFNLF